MQRLIVPKLRPRGQIRSQHVIDGMRQALEMSSLCEWTYYYQRHATEIKRYRWRQCRLCVIARPESSPLKPISGSLLPDFDPALEGQLQLKVIEVFFFWWNWYLFNEDVIPHFGQRAFSRRTLKGNNMNLSPSDGALKQNDETAPSDLWGCCLL